MFFYFGLNLKLPCFTFLSACWPHNPSITDLTGKYANIDNYAFLGLIFKISFFQKSWFCDFLTSSTRQLKILNIWRRTPIVAIPVTGKGMWSPKNYRPISPLCLPFKILQRLIYARIDPIIDPLLPREQADFRHGRSTVDQVTLLAQDIEDSFSAEKKAGAVCVNLTAAYDTVWHHGLTPKLLWLLLRRLKNGVPQESVLAPLLFNMYISNLPTTVSRKYAYADDLAIMHDDGDWRAVEGALSKDVATVGEYLQTRMLNLSSTKTVSAAFHLSNMEAKRELKVNFNNETLPFCSEAKFLAVTLDRSLMYRRRLESLRKQLTSRVALLRLFAGTGWGAGAANLRTATLWWPPLPGALKKPVHSKNSSLVHLKKQPP